MKAIACLIRRWVLTNLIGGIAISECLSPEKREWQSFKPHPRSAWTSTQRQSTGRDHFFRSCANISRLLGVDDSRIDCQHHHAALHDTINNPLMSSRSTAFSTVHEKACNQRARQHVKHVTHRHSAAARSASWKACRAPRKSARLCSQSTAVATVVHAKRRQRYSVSARRQ